MTEKSFESVLKFFFFSVLRRYLFTLKDHLKVLFELEKAAKRWRPFEGRSYAGAHLAVLFLRLETYFSRSA